MVLKPPDAFAMDGGATKFRTAPFVVGLATATRSRR
jgi:hypothetical protein